MCRLEIQFSTKWMWGDVCFSFTDVLPNAKQLHWALPGIVDTAKDGHEQMVASTISERCD